MTNSSLRPGFEGKLTAFLAASPIYAREGWYLEDILRLKSTPAGASELLITTLFDHLRVSGCQFATLGTASLVGVESQRDHPVVRWVLLHNRRDTSGVPAREDVFRQS